MNISNKTYDILKWIAQIALPALGTLYFALSTIWGLPYGEQVIGTITAVDVFLGALLGISASKYMNGEGVYDGTLRVDQDSNLINVRTNITVDEALSKKVVSLKVDPNARLR